MSQQWAAGLFDGEGCFTVSTTAGRRYLVASISMHPRDRDVLERFAETLGAGNVSGPHANGMCRWSVTGKTAEEMLARNWKFVANLGHRRTERLAECIHKVRTQPPAMTNQESGRLGGLARDAT